MLSLPCSLELSHRPGRIGSHTEFSMSRIEDDYDDLVPYGWEDRPAPPAARCRCRGLLLRRRSRRRRSELVGGGRYHQGGRFARRGRGYGPNADGRGRRRRRRRRRRPTFRGGHGLVNKSALYNPGSTYPEIYVVSTFVIRHYQYITCESQ